MTDCELRGASPCPQNEADLDRRRRSRPASSREALAREAWPRAASPARDVLAALDDSSPQVLVTDIRMPGGSGIDLLKN